MKDFGLLEELREVGEYVLGQFKMPSVPYQENGNWEPYLPKYENQTTRYGHETSGCTVWGTLNAIETFMKRLYGDEPNYSERFTYLNVPIDIDRGADPHKTCETIRKYGVVDEKYLQMTDTIEEYLDRSGLTPKLYERGKEWLKNHDFKHEWVWQSSGTRPQNYIDVLRQALKTSPIGVSVSAWNREGDVYVSTGDVNNHWCMLYKIDEEGYPWVFDSYDHTKKKLSKDHNIRRAKRFWVNRKIKRDMRKHISVLQSIVNFLMQKPKTLLEVCNEHIGVDASPNDIAPDELGCAETVSTLINKVDRDFPIIPGTWTLWNILNNRTNYERVTVPSPETIIISPTGTGNGSIPGHVGIMLDDGVIASNDSATGKFIKNYTLDTWQKRYVEKGGFKVYMYKQKV